MHVRGADPHASSAGESTVRPAFPCETANSAGDGPVSTAETVAVVDRLADAVLSVEILPAM
jgi:hypothetical protein